MELPYKKKFHEIPEIDINEIVEYFNLEFGEDSEEKLKESDFDYIGIYVINGYERMYWKLKGKDLFAVVKPFEDSYIIEMDNLPANAVKIE